MERVKEQTIPKGRKGQITKIDNIEKTTGCKNKGQKMTKCRNKVQKRTKCRKRHTTGKNKIIG